MLPRPSINIHDHALPDRNGGDISFDITNARVIDYGAYAMRICWRHARWLPCHGTCAVYRLPPLRCSCPAAMRALFILYADALFRLFCPRHFFTYLALRLLPDIVS